MDQAPREVRTPGHALKSSALVINIQKKPTLTISRRTQPTDTYFHQRMGHPLSRLAPKGGQQRGPVHAQKPRLTLPAPEASGRGARREAMRNDHRLTQMRGRGPAALRTARAPHTPPRLKEGAAGAHTLPCLDSPVPKERRWAGATHAGADALLRIEAKGSATPAWGAATLPCLASEARQAKGSQHTRGPASPADINGRGQGRQAASHPCTTVTAHVGLLRIKTCNAN